MVLLLPGNKQGLALTNRALWAPLCPVVIGQSKQQDGIQYSGLSRSCAHPSTTAEKNKLSSGRDFGIHNGEYTERQGIKKNHVAAAGRILCCS
jgi:hypothetical protein